MRKSFAMDSRARDFREPDRDHELARDTMRQEVGQGEQGDRALAGDPTGPAVPRGVPPERAASA